ncbi:hypothetical protein DSM106972_043120 [Dulcicalothrix desertica PCC 7102]|uniref:Peptidase M48 domain-containing protein n=1 Tax=Dulcicalothrix desertica PCC 7102 TaxID=232991 RepID=A0A433VF85_9CYAN|nr:M48 family metallopeptidase [Dulcicalothrix desertica]RUT04743.1 hypothetical protein DSM106972_043120 [Dulcicalothrix desertica PCC 7102]TWH42754.1 peptidase M48-like protein [Dulcicalothrix desertica PCC 7102]
MISSQKLLCHTLGVTAAFLSLVSYRDIAYGTQPVPTQSSSKSNSVDIEDEKPIYSVAEKIIRANGLDENPWRLKVENEYDDNASATDVNQIVLLKGLLDKVDGDEAAIAFILGHEIAHHTQKHIYSYTTYAARLNKQLQAEVDAKVQSIIATETKKFETARSTKRRGKSLCPVQNTAQKTSLSAIPEYVALNCQGKPDSDKIEQLKQQITAEREPELYSQIKKLSRQQEYEADKFGYMYMVRAGYSPEGALRVLNLMSRLPYHDTDDSTHPSFLDRLNAIKEFMNKYPAPSLVAEGETRLRLNPQPLTYDVSKDGESLRINSRFGSQRQVP